MLCYNAFTLSERLQGIMSERKKLLVLRKMRQRVFSVTMLKAMRDNLDDDTSVPMLRMEDLYRDRVSAYLN